MTWVWVIPKTNVSDPLTSLIQKMRAKLVTNAAWMIKQLNTTTTKFLKKHFAEPLDQKVT
jgi:hypothetical protein